MKVPVYISIPPPGVIPRVFVNPEIPKEILSLNAEFNEAPLEERGGWAYMLPPPFVAGLVPSIPPILFLHSSSRPRARRGGRGDCPESCCSCRRPRG